MIKPQCKSFVLWVIHICPHHPPHLLDVGGQRLAEWPSRHADHHVRHVKAFGQNVSGDQAMYLCVRLRELSDDILLELLVVAVTQSHKVVARLRKLLRQVRAMSYARAKHNGFAGTAKDFHRLGFPLCHHIACNLDASVAGFRLAPFTGHLLGTGHVDLFGHKDLQRHQHLLVDQIFGGHSRDDVVVDLAQPLGEGRSSQANHPHVWVLLDELDRLLTGLVRLVHDQQVETRKATALLQRLRRANLDAFVWPVSPMGGLHDTVVDVVLVQPCAGLVAQNDAIQNHCRLVALGAYCVKQSDSHLSLAATRGCVQDLSPFAGCKPLAESIQRLGLIRP